MKKLEKQVRVYFMKNYIALIDFNNFWDELEPNPIFKNEKEKKKINYAWCLKRLVSKKKRRFETEEFDLDLSYITKRIIAMGYPSGGFEALYRNSISDITRFFKIEHNNMVKVS